MTDPNVPIVPGPPVPPPVPSYGPPSAPPAYDPYRPQPQLVTKPGGLSSTAHAVHILIVLLTLGLWLPGYLLFVLLAPKRRTEVIVPYGADPAAVQAANAAAAPTKAERDSHNRVVFTLLGAALIVFLLCAFWPRR